jgi:nitroreductase
MRRIAIIIKSFISIYPLLKSKSQTVFWETLMYDYRRSVYSMYIGKASEVNNSKYLLTFINIWYHSLEKGLSVNKKRLGFGREKVVELSRLLLLYKGAFNGEEVKNNTVIIAAKATLVNYYELHERENYILDDEVVEAIEKIKLAYKEIRTVNSTVEYAFEGIDKSVIGLKEAILKRRSVRQFESSTLIPREVILAAIQLAANCPSACNRQPFNVRYYDDREKINILATQQGGTAGFNCVPGLLVITYYRRFYHNAIERNSGFIDSGIYLMNLVYSLMVHNIDSCLLNNAFDINKDKKMRELIGDVEPDEEFVSFIAIGKADQKGLSPASHKSKIKNNIE